MIRFAAEEALLPLGRVLNGRQQQLIALFPGSTPAATHYASPMPRVTTQSLEAFLMHRKSSTCQSILLTKQLNFGIMVLGGTHRRYYDVAGKPSDV